MVQLLPASESHHHSHLGGMLDHGLEVLSFSAKLRQSYVLPQNAAPEEQSKQRDAWTAAVIYAALVHDIGKVIVDIAVSYTHLDVYKRQVLDSIFSQNTSRSSAVTLLVEMTIVSIRNGKIILFFPVLSSYCL